MALGNSEKEWFDSFKIYMEKKGYDINDPLTTTFLRGVIYAPIDKKDAPGGLAYYVKDVPIGVRTAAVPDHVMPDFEDLTGSESIDYLKTNIKALANFNEREIRALYAMAANGRLSLFDKNLDPKSERIVYIAHRANAKADLAPEGNAGADFVLKKTGKAASVPEKTGESAGVCEKTVSEIEAELESAHDDHARQEVLKSVFADTDDPAHVYKYIQDRKNIEENTPEIMKEAGLDHQADSLKRNMRRHIIVDYNMNPSYYSDNEVAKKRNGLLRVQAVSESKPEFFEDYKEKHPQFKAHQAGAETQFEAYIMEQFKRAVLEADRQDPEENLQEYLNGKSLADLVQDGMIRKADGTKFEIDNAPWDAALFIHEYMAGSDRKVVFCVNVPDKKDPEKMAEKRLGYVRYNALPQDGAAALDDAEVMPQLGLDSPEKGNDYSKENMSDLEPAQVSDELRAFLAQFQRVLSRAGLNVDDMNDRPRLKGYYPPGIERDVLKTWKFNGQTAKSSNGEDYVENIDALSETENEILQNNFDFSQAITEITGDNINQNKLHQLYSIMTLAKMGRLMLTLPGDKVANSHPVVFGSDRTLLVLEEDISDPRCEEILDGIIAPNGEEHAKTVISFVKNSERYQKDLEGESEYAERLKKAHEEVFITPYLTGVEKAEDTVGHIFTEARLKNIEKSEFLKIIESEREKLQNEKNDKKIGYENLSHLYENILTLPDDSGEKNSLPGLKFGKLRDSEIQKREELSRKAYREMFEVYYSSSDILPRLENDAKNGYISQKDLDLFYNTDRDFVGIMMDFISDSGNFIIDPAVDDNYVSEADKADRNSRTFGRLFGYIAVDPNSEDEKKRIFADAVNEKIKALVEFPYDNYLGLSDEKLVESYHECYEYFYKAGIIKKAISYIQDKYSDNPYIDQGLLNMGLDIDRKYQAVAGFMVERMRLIASPYYAKYPVENFAGLNHDVMQQIGKIAGSYGINKDDPEIGAAFKYNITDNNSWNYLKQCSGVDHLAREDYKTRIGYELGREFNVNMENVFFFDKEGNSLNVYECYAQSKKGNVVYCASFEDKNAIMAYSFNKEKGIPERAPKFMEGRKALSILEKIRKNMQPEYASFASMNSEYLSTYYNAAETGFIEDVHNLIKDAEERNLGDTDVRSMLHKHFNTPLFISKEKFFEVTELLDENEKLPEDSEIAGRRYKTVRAQEAIYDAGSYIYDKGSTPEHVFEGLSSETYDAVMRIGGDAGNADINSVILNDFMNGDKEKKREAVERVYNYYLGKGYLSENSIFNGPISDEDMIKNFSEIESALRAFGGEYVKFKQYLAGQGIEIDPELQKKADQLHSKIAPFAGHIHARMNYMASRYYQYQPEMSIQAAAGLSQLNDPEATKTKNIINKGFYDEICSIGEYALENVFPEGKDAIEYFVDKAGRIHSLEDVFECGQNIQDGGELLFVKKGDNQVKAFRFDTKVFPPIAHETVNDITREEINDAYYGERLRALEAEKRSNEDTVMEAATLEAREALDKLISEHSLAGEEIPDFRARYTNAITNFLTRVLLEKAYDSKESPEEKKKYLQTSELKKIRKQVEESGLVDKFIKKYPVKDSRLAKIDNAQLYAEIDSSLKELETEKNIRQAKEKAKEKDRVSENRISEIRLAKIASINMGQPDYFGIDVKSVTSVNAAEDPKAENHTLHMSNGRTALSTLALCMMLTQGCSVEEAFAPENAADRKIAGDGAVDAVKKGDYKFVMSMFIRGAAQMRKYMDKRLSAMEKTEAGICISELAKPENRLLITAALAMIDCSQELDKVNDSPAVPKEEKYDTKFKNEFADKLNVRTVIEFISKGIVMPAQNKDFNLTECLSNYIMADAMTQYIRKLRTLPENRDKSVSEMFENMDVYKGIYDANMLVMENIGKDSRIEKLSPEEKAKILASIEDDTFKEGLGLKINLNKTDGRLQVDIKMNLKEAYKQAGYRNPPSYDKLTQLNHSKTIVQEKEKETGKDKNKDNIVRQSAKNFEKGQNVLM